MRKDLRFSLPEGAYWRDVEDRDIPWLSQMHPDWDDLGVGILCVHYRLRDDREDLPTRGQERDCVLDNAGGIVMLDRNGETFRGGRDATGVIDGMRFYLTEGNMGCGCNRSCEFARAGGESPGLDEHFQCDSAITCTWPSWIADDTWQDEVVQ